jgi:zinc transport system permease protein
MIEMLSYPFFQRALIAGLLVSVACGIIGTYVVVKRIASISGSLSHAAFGGVGLGYLLGFSPILGATAFALASSLGLGFAYRRLSGTLDTLLAMVWSIGMALGMFFIAMSPGYAPDLMSYLFGSLLFISNEFLWFIVGLDVLILGVVFVLYKEFIAVVFDEEFAQTAGVPVDIVLHLLLALVALTVVILIQVVGVILVIALLTFPAAIARHWSNNLFRMMGLATVFAAVTTTLGLLGSFWLSTAFSLEVPTGPLIILTAAIIYIISSVLRAVPYRSKQVLSAGDK